MKPSAPPKDDVFQCRLHLLIIFSKRFAVIRMRGVWRIKCGAFPASSHQRRLLTLSVHLDHF